jgi:hypothetical protein
MKRERYSLSFVRYVRHHTDGAAAESAFCVELVFGEHLGEAVHAHDQLVYRFPKP